MCEQRSSRQETGLRVSIMTQEEKMLRIYDLRAQRETLWGDLSAAQRAGLSGKENSIRTQIIKTTCELERYTCGLWVPAN